MIGVSKFLYVSIKKSKTCRSKARTFANFKNLIIIFKKLLKISILGNLLDFFYYSH